MFTDNNEAILNPKKQLTEPELPPGIIRSQKIDLNIRGFTYSIYGRTKLLTRRIWFQLSVQRCHLVESKGLTCFNKLFFYFISVI